MQALAQQQLQRRRPAARAERALSAARSPAAPVTLARRLVAAAATAADSAPATTATSTSSAPKAATLALAAATAAAAAAAAAAASAACPSAAHAAAEVVASTAAAASSSPFPYAEPANALSLPTWAIHVSSVAEWLIAMSLAWRYAEVSGDSRWKGLTWGMVPALGSAFCACTWHFFYNAPELDVLVALQAFLTVVGNCTLWVAAYRLYKGGKEGAAASE